MKWKWKLDNDSIGKAVAQAEKEAEKVGVEGEQRLRFALSLEESLLICRERCGENATVSLRMVQRGRQLNVEIVLPTAFTGVFAREDSPLTVLLNEWESVTRNGKKCRIYTLELERTRGDLLRLSGNTRSPTSGGLYWA